MRIGAPFNPYKVFQGVFAPYWLLEHRGIGAGAKLCYIRLLGYAGKDARCYPSLGTLGAGLGVSERQARDYVRELERAGLIVVEQRGLRKTNLYLFVWTAELEALCNGVPEGADDPDDRNGGIPHGDIPDRNDCSGQGRNRTSAPDRNSSSAPDRNSSSAPDRNSFSGPIGINSLGISSVESSSSSAAAVEAQPTKTTNSHRSAGSPATESDQAPGKAESSAQTIVDWAKVRGIQRLRSDRRTGAPEKEHIELWSEIFERQGIHEASSIVAVLDTALAAANRSGRWRNWSFLTLQVQLAAERLSSDKPFAPTPSGLSPAILPEDAACDWAKAKGKIRKQVGEIPFTNWFAHTRQTERRASQIVVNVFDEPTLRYLETEYEGVIRATLRDLGIDDVQLFIGS